MTTEKPFSPAKGDRIRRSPGVSLRRVAGEHMLVPTVTREVDLDRLYLLNATGVFVWERLDGGASAGELAEAVAGAFGIDAERAWADVSAFLATLLPEHLAETADAHVG